MFELYQQYWWFDRVLHAATIFALTLWLALLMFGRAFQTGHGELVVLLAASGGLAVGAVWEAAEWGFDQAAPGDVIRASTTRSSTSSWTRSARQGLGG